MSRQESSAGALHTTIVVSAFVIARPSHAASTFTSDDWEARVKETQPAVPIEEKKKQDTKPASNPLSLGYGMSDATRDLFPYNVIAR